MSDTEDFPLKKRKIKKRTAAVLDDDLDSGSSLVSATVNNNENDDIPISTSISSTTASTNEGQTNITNPTKANNTNDDDTTLTGYVKRIRRDINGIDMNDPLVQLKSKAEIEQTTIGKDAATVSKSMQNDILMNSRTPTSTLEATSMGQVKLSSTMDYAADICKDFKLYGYCRWGESCIYSHDRSERKSGNQLDEEYKQSLVTAAEKRATARILVIPEGDKLPERCQICGDFFPTEEHLLNDSQTSSPTPKPISMTSCGHFFHQQCAMARFAAKNTTCYECDVETTGRFTPALKELKRRADANWNARQQHELKVAEMDREEKRGNRKAMLGGGY